jgi:hypothetical protein
MHHTPLLDEILAALAAAPQLKDALVFKGGRILNIHLAGGRPSHDLDANLTYQFLDDHPHREGQRQFLEQVFTQAIRVRVPQLTAVRVKCFPLKSHPMGWDGFKVMLKINDLGKPITLDIDLAAPEELLDSSLTTINVLGQAVVVYNLERIAGEKLRAFLSSLPTYRAKMKKLDEAIRARDLYDLTHIYRVHGLADVPFWQRAGEEFRVACCSRYIDCHGLKSFQEHWGVTRKAYEEATLPADITFAEAEATLKALVGFLEAEGVVPFEYPWP